MATFSQYLAAIHCAVRKLFRREPASPPVTPLLLPPDDLRFEYGHFPSGMVVRYRIKKGWISRTDESRVVRGRPSCRKRHPAAEDWLTFWASVAPLDLWHWKAEYFTPPGNLPFVIDGKSWRFSCRSGNRRVKSLGGQYYPKLGQPQETDSQQAALALLKKALDRLLSPFPLIVAKEHPEVGSEPNHESL